MITVPDDRVHFRLRLRDTRAAGTNPRRMH
jgi:hypothetical protein